jgi:hypothetical protein
LVGLPYFPINFISISTKFKPLDSHWNILFIIYIKIK